MSTTGKKLIHPTQNEFRDRQKDDNETFPELTVKLEKIDSILLLLDCKEEMVLVTILQHMNDYARKNDDNISLLKNSNILELLLLKDFFLLSRNVIVRRSSLYLAAHIVERMKILQELETSKILEIIRVCLKYYMGEGDNFCQEYLSVIMNKCLDDPKAVKQVLEDQSFVEIFFRSTAISSNPDLVLHSLEMLEKMLLVPGLQELQKFVGHPLFPIKRILCGLTSDYLDIRRAALKVIRLLILDTSESGPFSLQSHKTYVLEQLTKMFCENLMLHETDLVIDCLGAALRQEDMAQKFFEINLFESYIKHMNDDLEPGEFCKSLLVLSEAAKYPKLLPRLVTAEVTEKLLDCLHLVGSQPSVHILVGLNRMMKSLEVPNRIVEAYERGVVAKLLALVKDILVDFKTREEAALLLLNLLTFAFHTTAGELLELQVSVILADIFGQEAQYQSIDLLLSLLNIVENLASNVGYREKLCENESLVDNMGLLLMHSFSAAILVNHIFRCLCTIIEEESVRRGLLQCYIASSIKRALKSLSNLVKTSVTNFIMQTSRFPEFLSEYIERGVLEVLFFHQQHAFCVPTWGPAIESILSKTPTLKFCIRNHLSFIDVTTGHDFFVSKKKFENFCMFQTMLTEDVSPLQPILVVNFERPITPEDRIVRIPKECLTPEECKCADQWCYCRTPGDASLPRYLKEVNDKMEEFGLTADLANPRRSAIDFENMAKRVKIIAQVVAQVMSKDLMVLDLNDTAECSLDTVQCHLKELAKSLHCAVIPLGHIRSGCQFERAILFKALADQVGLPCTLQRSVDGRILFNEVPLPLEMERDIHCDPKTMKYMPWRMLRPTHLVDLMYNVGELYPLQSRQAVQYLRLN